MNTKIQKILAIAALAGLSACTVYPDGTTVVHSPPAAAYVAPVYTAPVYVAPRPYYYNGYYNRPYYYNRYYR
jgi:hypothetical protein